MTRRLTYAASGVSLNRATGILNSIAKNGELSFFASVVSGLAFSADGVGTKTELLRRFDLDWVSGWDCVAMNANDLLCVGAKPLWFLDYYAQGKLNKAVFERVLAGMKKALDYLGAKLIGGETAELPGTFAQEAAYDVAGFLVGQVAKEIGLDRRRVCPGDLIVGLASEGPHANGFSLIRKALSFGDIRRLKKDLLAPTRLYHREVYPLLKNQKTARWIRSLAHITGGGFFEKLPRAMNEHCQAQIQWNSWTVPDIFGTLSKKANLKPQQACGVWNMGIGFVLIVDEKGLPAVNAALGPSVRVIGQIAKRKPGKPAVLVY